MRLVVVAGALANKPRNGGEAWVRLSWVRALARLGLQVHFVEQLDSAVVGRHSDSGRWQDSLSARYFQDVIRGFGLTSHATLFPASEEDSIGRTFDELLNIAAEADLLINISGNLRSQRLLKVFRRKAYVDIDPGFTQRWHMDARDVGLAQHDIHFTIAENIGAAGCQIPTAGVRWLTTRQPVVLEDWPVRPIGERRHFSTIATWRGYGSIAIDGEDLGSKVYEFRKYINLPARVPATFELALNIDAAETRDLQLLRTNGWKLVDPHEVASDPGDFRRYVQGSGAEFSVAQGVYVATASGWFSDRTTRYLASGKPALVQDTGFLRHIPSGEGLIAFATPQDAVDGAEAIMADYEVHSRAARVIAEEFFDSDKVVSAFLDDAL